MSNNISKFHLELLDSHRRIIFDKLASGFPNCILGGGTALALQIFHRKSYDFDFFNRNPIDKSLLMKLKNYLVVQNVEVDNEDELTVLTDQKIKISFIYYPFPSFFDRGIFIDKYHIFSIEDIAIQKCYTIGRRGAYRDYFDLYSVLANHYMTLKEIISGAEKAYGNLFSTKLFLQQLVYFGDITEYGIESPADNTVIPTVDTVKTFLSEQVMSYLEQ